MLSKCCCLSKSIPNTRKRKVERIKTEKVSVAEKSPKREKSISSNAFPEISEERRDNTPQFSISLAEDYLVELLYGKSLNSYQENIRKTSVSLPKGTVLSFIKELNESNKREYKW